MMTFEDFSEGQTFVLANTPVSHDEIVTFAAEFDPQSFHLDDAAAQDTILGGLAASGWHTCGILMSMIVRSWLGNAECVGGPGIEEVQWKRPLRPGDQLSGTTEIVSCRTSKSRPGAGIIVTKNQVHNQDGELVIQMTFPAFIRRRNSA